MDVATFASCQDTITNITLNKEYKSFFLKYVINWNPCSPYMILLITMPVISSWRFILCRPQRKVQFYLFLAFCSLKQKLAAMTPYAESIHSKTLFFLKSGNVLLFLWL